MIFSSYHLNSHKSPVICELEHRRGGRGESVAGLMKHKNLLMRDDGDVDCVGKEQESPENDDGDVDCDDVSWNTI